MHTYPRRTGARARTWSHSCISICSHIFFPVHSTVEHFWNSISLVSLLIEVIGLSYEMNCTRIDFSWSHLLGIAVLSYAVFASTRTPSILVEILSLFSISSSSPHFPLWFGKQLIQCRFKSKERKKYFAFRNVLQNNKRNVKIIEARY